MYIDDVTSELEGMSSPIEIQARTEDFDAEEEYHNEGVGIHTSWIFLFPIR